jgi:hypothetical protein
MARRTGRHEVSEFDRLVSPLGEDAAETPVYSPSKTVNGAKGQPGIAPRLQGAYAKELRRQGNGDKPNIPPV